MVGSSNPKAAPGLQPRARYFQEFFWWAPPPPKPLARGLHQTPSFCWHYPLAPALVPHDPGFIEYFFSGEGGGRPWLCILSVQGRSLPSPHRDPSWTTLCLRILLWLGPPPLNPLSTFHPACRGRGKATNAEMLSLLFKCQIEGRASFFRRLSTCVYVRLQTLLMETFLIAFKVIFPLTKIRPPTSPIYPKILFSPIDKEPFETYTYENSAKVTEEFFF